MPLYEYECNRCEHRFELLQKFSDKPRQRCPECRGKVERLISAPAIRFKGTGWYVTDYAGKGKEPDAEKTSAGADDAASKDAKGTDKDDKAKKAKKKKGTDSATAAA